MPTSTSALILYKNNIQHGEKVVKYRILSTALILYKNNIQHDINEVAEALD